MRLQKAKGTADISPAESYKWQYIESTAKEVFSTYNFKEIRTPIFEHYEVVKRSVGDSTDIVQKEMYDFYDKGDRHVTLRPEGTAPVVRSFVENKFFAPEVPKPFKAFYIGPMFRYERPQSGRLRQFHQIGVEALGVRDAGLDVQIIAMVDRFFKKLGLSKFSIRLNSLGTNESRATYKEALIEYFTPHLSELSEDSQRRLTENPLRVLDSKDKRDKELSKDAPSILDFLSEESRAYFEELKSLLDTLDIAYLVDDTIIRGLDYYTDTIFEFVAEINGQELTLCGGGRYDGLVEYFEGPATPGVGFAIGIERLLLALELENVVLPEEEKLDLFIAILGKENKMEAVKISEAIRAQGFKVEHEYPVRKLGAQFKTAENLGAKVILTLGADEVATGNIVLKNNISRKEVKTTISTISENFLSVYQEVLSES